MQECVISTPPAVDQGRVTFSVVHNDTGRIFRCVMTSFDSVEITPLPRELTPWAEGSTRAEVAEYAKEYARAHSEQFRELFEQAAAEQRSA